MKENIFLSWGHFIRRTRWIWIIAAFIFSYYGFLHGFELFSNLNNEISSPRLSPSDKATHAFVHLFPNQLKDSFPSSTLISIKLRPGNSQNDTYNIIRPETKSFQEHLVDKMFCKSEKITFLNSRIDDDCNSTKKPLFLRFVRRIVGYDVDTDELSWDTDPLLKDSLISKDSTTMEIIIQHNFGFSRTKTLQFFAFLESFLQWAQRNKDVLNDAENERYLVSYASEIKLLEVAKQATVYDFEHSDMIGIPFAWLILFYTCGLPAFVVLFTLPASILFSFYICVYFLADDLPQFAPSLLVSISVALNVDYALFFLARYRSEMNSQLALACSTDENSTGGKSALNDDLRSEILNNSLDRALLSSGKTILISGTIFLLTTFSLSFVSAQTISSLGIGLFLTNIVTIVINLTILPALTHSFSYFFLDNNDFSVRRSLRRFFRQCYKRCTGKYFSKDEQIVHDSENYGDYHTFLDESNDSAQMLLGQQKEDSMVNKEVAVAFMESRSNLFGSSMGSIRNLCTPANEESPIFDEDSEDNEDESTQSVVVSAEQLNFEPQTSFFVKLGMFAERFPKAVIFFCFILFLPFGYQLTFIKKTDDQRYLLPLSNRFVGGANQIVMNHMNVGHMADFKMIIASNFNKLYFDRPLKDKDEVPKTNPKFGEDMTSFVSVLKLVLDHLDLSSYQKQPEVTKHFDVECFDDNAFMHSIGKLIGSHAVICPLVTLLIPACHHFPAEILSDVEMQTSRLGADFFLQILKNICPHSCRSCRAELVTSKQFFEVSRNVTSKALKVLEMFERNSLQKKSTNTLENPSFVLGDFVSWEDARRVIESDFSGTSSDSFSSYYSKTFLQSVGLNHTAHSTRLMPSLDPFGKDGHPLVHELRKQVLGLEAFDTNFSIFVGGSLTALYDQVDSVYSTGPIILGLTVVLTVIGTSLLVFRSAVLGPRLLLTILYTVSFVFGASVLVYQRGDNDDQSNEPNEGLYWIVPVVGLPVVVGCTLDYDSYLVARIFEFRLAGLDTPGAIIKGLEDTAHIITLAGFIMTVAFGSMMFSSVTTINQIGFILVMCSLLDTFLVRTLLVPALMFEAGETNWYPSKLPPPTQTLDKTGRIIRT